MLKYNLKLRYQVYVQIPILKLQLAIQIFTIKNHPLNLSQKEIVTHKFSTLKKL